MNRRLIPVMIVLVMACAVALVYAQSQTPPPAKPQQQQKPPDTTGPDRPVGETVVGPRRPPTRKAMPRRPAEQKPGEPPFAIAVDVNLVSVDVSVQDRDGNFLHNLKKQNFKILEDGVPQNVQTFEQTEAPMTVVLVVEFNNLYQSFWSETWYQTLTASYGFVETLRPEDWIAVVAYDLKPEILQDFTQNKQAAFAALQRLRFPAFSEANLFDTLEDTLSRLSDVGGRKGIVLISTGIDTFSKITYDKILNKVKESDTPIYPIGLMQMVREMADARGYMGPIMRMDFLQADNALRTFAQYTGGRAFFPRFYGEFPSIFAQISAHMRNTYQLGYVPTNTARDGKFRKLKVELVDDSGQPFKLVNKKGKEVKYTIYAKTGYNAPKGGGTVQ